MAIEQVLRLQFGKNGECENHIGTGWSLAEARHRWMIGAFSQVRIGPVIAGGDYLLILDIEPFVSPPSLSLQHLSISIAGIPFAQAEIAVGGRFGYRIPPEVITEDGDVTLVFDHPDAARPTDLDPKQKDHRPLAILTNAIEVWRIDGKVNTATAPTGGALSMEELGARVGLPPDEFMSRFESLGENCEFGLVQRRCGAEPLSLLRFSNTLLANLSRGLLVGFEGLGEPDDLTFRLEGKIKSEYIVEEKRYGLVYHTFRYKGEIDEDKFLVSESARLKFLVRKFMEDLRGGEKIFVCKRIAPLREEEILPLLTALNAHGPVTLLWVVVADSKHPAGSAEWVMPGLIKGYVDRFAPNENAHDLSLEVWLSTCANAFELWKHKAEAE